MKVLRMLAALFCLLFLVAMNVPSSRADEHDKLTKFTFSGPVEVPGFPRTTVLPAGTYVFKLANSTSNRNIVQIFNEDQTHIYATVLAISNYRLTPSDKTIITFGERPAGTPEAIRAWFYPGDNYGQEFVYPKYRAVELAQQTGQPVPSMAEGTEQNSEALEQAPVNNEGQSEVAENTPASANSTSDNTSDNTTPASTTPASTTPASTLPKTASDMPLAALGGMLLLGLGICLRLLSRKSA
ncbi:MAG: hypothetical protein WA175_08220 [Candidatus Acidiferrales bacterium]